MTWMTYRGSRWLAGAGVGAALILAAAGCGSSGSKTASSTGAAPTTATGAAASAGHVTVSETEFRLGFSTMAFTPGTWTFDAVNNGKVVHALEVDGPGVHAVTTDLQPGQSATLTVSLQAGQYDVFCPVPGHKALGMNAEITVAGAGGTSPATTPAATTPAAPATTTAPTTVTTAPPTTVPSGGSGSVSY